MQGNRGILGRSSRVVSVKQNDAVAKIVGESSKRVVATTNIPPNTYVATYPGWVYTEHVWSELVGQGKRGHVYSVQAFDVLPNGRVDFSWVIDPTNGVNRVAPQFQGSFGPFTNEPGPSQSPNVRWVYNFTDNTMEYWTARKIRKGEELLVAYGGTYQRDYATSKKTRQDYFIIEPMPKPVPWTPATEKELRPVRSKAFAAAARQARHEALARDPDAHPRQPTNQVLPRVQKLFRNADAARTAAGHTHLEFCWVDEFAYIENNGSMTKTLDRDACFDVWLPKGRRTTFGEVVSAALQKLKEVRPHAVCRYLGSLNVEVPNLLHDRKVRNANLKDLPFVCPGSEFIMMAYDPWTQQGCDPATVHALQTCLRLPNARVHAPAPVVGTARRRNATPPPRLHALIEALESPHPRRKQARPSAAAV